MKHKYMTKRRNENDGKSYKDRLQESINKGGTKIEDMMESPFKECNRMVNHRYSKKLT